MTEPQGGRIRITHWLLLSACCAGVASVQHLATEWSTVPAAQQRQLKTDNLFRTLAFGAALAGGAAAVSAWRRGTRRSSLSPGAWLLLWMGSLVILLGAAELTSALLAGDSSPFVVWQTQKLVYHTLSAASCAAFGALTPGDRRWKAVLFTPAVTLLAAAGLHLWALAFYQNNIRPLAVLMIATCLAELLLVASACLRDRREAVARDWLHWSGVALFAAIAAQQLIVAAGWLLQY